MPHFDPPDPPLMVLHVDDDPINRRVLQELLHVLGHKGFEADCAGRALDLARLGTFDLLLMDLHMPGMNGVEAVRALRTASGPESAIPVVAVTADVVSLSLADCLELGFSGLLFKPVSLRSLKQEIGRAWRRGQAATSGGWKSIGS